MFSSFCRFTFVAGLECMLQGFLLSSFIHIDIEIIAKYLSFIFPRRIENFADSDKHQVSFGLERGQIHFITLDPE